MSISIDRLRALQRQAGRGNGGASKASGCDPTSTHIANPEPHQPSPPHAEGKGQKASARGINPAHVALGSLSPACGGEGWGDGDLSDRENLNANGRITTPAATSITTLRRLLGLRDQPLATARPRIPLDRHLPGIELEPGLRLIETHQPFACPHAQLPLAFARRDTHVDPRDLLFFDTETTGLAGGTGTRAFMVGAADWHVHPLHGDGLRVRQLLITTLAAEPAMLRTFATWLAPTTVLSSYNGRCYDAPLLRTRYRLARMADALGTLDHVDLLFPTRRRYRGTWENCRLATIERELLQIVREDDLPGAQAPAAWLTYLRGGSSSLLQRVCTHNHQDVVTLARLMLRLVDAHAAG